MIFDHRTYTVKPGTIARQLALYDQHGRAPQERHLGKPIYYAVTETGAVNTYIHVWAYDSAGDREQRRAAMQADPEWQAYLGKSGEAGYLIGQENQLMTPVAWFQPQR